MKFGICLQSMQITDTWCEIIKHAHTAVNKILQKCLKFKSYRFYKLSQKWIGGGEPISWPPHLPDLTLLVFLLGAHQGCSYVPPLATTLTEVSGNIRVAVAAVTEACLATCCLKLNTDMVSARPLMVPSLSTHKMWLTRM